LNPKAQAKVEPETGLKPEASPEVKAESKSKTKAADPRPGGKDESTPETKTNIPSDLTPQIVKRVHALYEELGREDLRAVEDLEMAEQENRKDGTRAEAKAEPKARV
jgi:H+-transporting ATPase